MNETPLRKMSTVVQDDPFFREDPQKEQVEEVEELNKAQIVMSMLLVYKEEAKG